MKKSVITLIILLIVSGMFIFSTTSFSADTEMENIIPGIPANVTAINTPEGVGVYWDAVENTAGYKIYRSADGGEPQELQPVRGTDSASFTDTDVKSGVQYTYKVMAYNAYNASELSEPADIVHLSQPVLKTVANAYGGIKLRWSSVKGAEWYCIYRSLNNSQYEMINCVSGKVNESIDEDVKDKKKYSYKVEAINGIYHSAFGERQSDMYISAPVLKSAKNYEDYVELVWKKVSSAQKYIIYRKTEKSDWKALKTVSSSVTSYKDKTAKGGVLYRYTVKSVSGDVKSGCDKAGIEVRRLASPAVTSIKNQENRVAVKWEKVSGASQYKLYRKSSADNKWVELTQTKSRSYTDSKVKNGVYYRYKVKAVSSEGYIGKADSGEKILCLKAPSYVKTKCTPSGIKITWKSMDTARSYGVYKKKLKDKSWKKIGTTDKKVNTFVDSDVTAGKEYLYTVKQFKGDYAGSYNTDGVKVMYVTPPKVKVKHSPKGVVVSWDKAVAGDGYKIQRKVSGGEWKTIKTISKLSQTSYTDSKPSFGKLNYYRVAVTGGESTLISYARSLYGINPKKKMVALTYDDGPYTPVTNQILDTLEKYNGRATFFVVGSRVGAYSACVSRAYNMGSEIGNHTYNHTILTSVGASKILSEISQTNEVVKAVTGEYPKIVRTPGGAVNSTVRANIGYPMFNWSVDTLDWKYRNSSSVISSVKNNVCDGSIVLMHDLYTSTGNASVEIIPWLVDNGYQLVTVSELMAVKGIDVKAGELYCNG